MSSDSISRFIGLARSRPPDPLGRLSSAMRTVRMISSFLSGLVRNPRIPSRPAIMASSLVPNPVINTTGRPTSSLRTSCRTSRPVIPGIYRSSNIRSMLPCRTRLSATNPFSASMTSIPSLRSNNESIQRIFWSSSVMSTRTLSRSLPPTTAIPLPKLSHESDPAFSGTVSDADFQSVQLDIWRQLPREVMQSSQVDLPRKARL